MNNTTSDSKNTERIGEQITRTLEEALKRIINEIRNNQLDYEMLSRPKEFNGERDPFLIDSWIHSIDNYIEYRNFEDKQGFKYAKTLMKGMAQVWLRNIEENRDEELITTWTQLKTKIISSFKPSNTVIYFRDRFASLRQTSSISKYIDEFMTIKSGIPRMTDDEAVAKLISGLKAEELKMQLRGLYKNNMAPSLSKAIELSYIFESSEGNYYKDIIASSLSSTYVINQKDNRNDYIGSSKKYAICNRRDYRFQHTRSNNTCYNYEQRRHLQGRYHIPRHTKRNQYINSQSYRYNNDECSKRQIQVSREHNDRKCKNNSNCLSTVNKQLSDNNYESHVTNAHQLQQDLEFINNANLISNKLPLYHILINGHPHSVLIDSGASANYISPKLQHIITNVTKIPTQTVEVADGNQSSITSIASFDIKLGAYTENIKAYMFETKFDLILGQAWLSTAQPTPNWFEGTWKIKSKTYPYDTVTIHPIHQCKNNQAINQSKMIQPKTNSVIKDEHHKDIVAKNDLSINKVESCTAQDKSQSDASLDFLLTAKQFDRMLKKKQVEKCYFIDIQHILQNEPLYNINSGSKARNIDNHIHQQWCEEFSKKYPNVFKGKIDSLPPLREMTENIIELYPDYVPQSIPPYKMSPIELRELRSQIDTLISQGLLEPTTSQFGSPVLFVKRQGDTKMRMVCDYRSINKATIAQGIPVPRIDECLEQLHGAKYFSSLDLKSGFHQLRLTDEDSDKTTINTRYGQYRWKVIPFGLKNSGRQFMRTINHILKDFIDKICICYIDDILIFTKDDDVEVHKRHVEMILKRLNDEGLIVNKDKCKFMQKRVTFLGFDLIANEGISPSQKKVSAITEWPTPTNVQEVRKFIGLCQYYKMFIPDFSSIASPITDLTKGSGSKTRGINWTTDCQNSFDKLKQLITSAPILLTPDMSKKWRIECDASDYGIGMVLLQQDPDNDHVWKPVAFESKKFSSQERNYPAQEREILSIIHALRTWRCFVDGNEYEVYTDHLPLKYYNDTKKISPRLVRWMDELSLYNPTIIYKSGVENVIPDLLSRRDGVNCTPETKSMEPENCNTIILRNPQLLYSISENQNTQDDLINDWPLQYFKSEEEWPEKIKQKLTAQKDKFKTENQFIWRKIKATQNGANKEVWAKFIPYKRRADLVEDYHKGFGHQGKATIQQLMSTRFWWPQIKDDIKTWLQQCPECQLHSRKDLNTHHAPMKPLDIPPPFSRWHLDFIGELPSTSKENKWILMAVDYNTNYPIARAMKNATGDEIVNFIYEEIVMRFGCPAEIVTDRGTNFMSKILNQYIKKIKVKHNFTSAFHPRSNSKCERLNQTFKHMLIKYVKGNVHSWDEFLDSALFACRVRKHTTMGFSPFYATYGVDPILPGDVMRPFINPFVEEDQELIAEDTLSRIRLLRESRREAEENAKIQARKDKERWDAAMKTEEPQTFEINDYVLLRHESKKGLEFNWMGPYKVIKKNIDFNTYQIQEVDGKVYSSWVHTDRLLPVKYDGSPIDKAWYIPRVARSNNNS